MTGSAPVNRGRLTRRPGAPQTMTRSIRLRPWQKAALERFDASPGPDFLAVATPGAGKTTFALTAAVGEMASRRTGPGG